MASDESIIGNQKSYEQLHSYLYEEVSLLRGLLSLLTEIESAIRAGDSEQANQLSKERNSMQKELKALQKKRFQATTLLFETFNIPNEEKHLTSNSFIEAMTLSSDFGPDLLSLKDQLLTLLKKIEVQKTSLAACNKFSSLEIFPEKQESENNYKNSLKTIDPEESS